MRPPSDTGKKKWAIDELPGRQLFLRFHSTSTENAFGMVNLAEGTTRAREYAYVDSDDLDELIIPIPAERCAAPIRGWHCQAGDTRC